MTVNKLHRILRGAALVLVGAAMIQMSAAGCSHKQNKARVPEEGEKIVYSDLNYVMVQGTAIHKPSKNQGMEYVFIPLTFKNGSDNNIIFSSYVCINAYAVPSGEKCSAADKDVISFGRDNIGNFGLFDGIIYGHKDTQGWIAFELPQGSQSVHIDFQTGNREGEMLSFDCKL